MFYNGQVRIAIDFAANTPMRDPAARSRCKTRIFALCGEPEIGPAADHGNRIMPLSIKQMVTNQRTSALQKNVPRIHKKTPQIT